MLEKLKNCKDYRSFLTCYLELQNINYAVFASQAGFGRGFPSDVISGKRRLTPKSAPAFEQALKLPSTVKHLFRLLVAQEESDTFIDVDRTVLPELIKAARQKIALRPRRSNVKIEGLALSTILSDSRSMALLAASGSPENGASETQLRERTQIKSPTFERLLQNLIEQNLIIQKNGQYLPQDLHLHFQTTDRDSLLTNIFQKAARSASEKSLSRDEGSELFFASQFCVSEKDMPQFKIKLRELITSFVTDSINEDGDRVVKLTTALHF